jgi:hypothetical protein
MEHTWKIYDLERTISNGVIFKVLYGCNSEKDGIARRKTGELELSGSDSDEGFIPYDNLKESDVLGWLASAIDQPAIEAENAALIQEHIAELNSTDEANGTPW